MPVRALNRSSSTPVPDVYKRQHVDVPAAAVRVRTDDMILTPQQVRLIADGVDRHELPRDRLHLTVARKKGII